MAAGFAVGYVPDFHLHLLISDVPPSPALPHRVIKDDVYNGEIV